MQTICPLVCKYPTITHVQIHQCLINKIYKSKFLAYQSRASQAQDQWKQWSKDRSLSLWATSHKKSKERKKIHHLTHTHSSIWWDGYRGKGRVLGQILENLSNALRTKKPLKFRSKWRKPCLPRNRRWSTFNGDSFHENQEEPSLCEFWSSIKNSINISSVNIQDSKYSYTSC